MYAFLLFFLSLSFFLCLSLSLSLCSLSLSLFLSRCQSQVRVVVLAQNDAPILTVGAPATPAVANYSGIVYMRAPAAESRRDMRER
jgi:hypothetical protein